jgi:hypothetical protein
VSEPVLCDRCGTEALADRIDVSTYAEPGLWVWGRIVCGTLGCIDEDGSAAVLPPDAPGELNREDRRWLRLHQRLAEEYGRVVRALQEVG